MRNKTLVAGFVLLVALAWSVNAYAHAGQQCSGWCGFWESVGGFVYNALPWNWGNWAGK